MLIYQRGITLIELMIAGTIGLFAISVIIAIYHTTAIQTMRQIEAAHLYNISQSILALIQIDLRRTGYWHIQPGKDSLRTNPFQNSVNRIQIAAAKNQTHNSCITFSYDLDKDGKVGVGKCPENNCSILTDADNVEQFGFRLKDRTIQMRYAGKKFNCQSGFWQVLTEPSIVVTKFKIQLNIICLNLSNTKEPCSDMVDRQLVQTIDVDFSAHNNRRSDIKIDLKRQIQVRNDRFISAGSTL